MRDLLLIAAVSLLTVWDIAANDMLMMRTIAMGLVDIGQAIVGV